VTSRSVRRRRAFLLGRDYGRQQARYPWVRSAWHIISPYEQRLRAAAMPDTCSLVQVDDDTVVRVLADRSATPQERQAVGELVARLIDDDDGEYPPPAPPPAERPARYFGRWPPACGRCGHRHAGAPCANHAWDDPCPYDAGADCAGPGRHPLPPYQPERTT
jgi:hypothetical protein